MTTPGPHPRPGPVGPDIDELCSRFNDLLAESIGGPDAGTDGKSVLDDQVAALDAAHELLAQALTALDSRR
ncbi:hypothetical protein [Dietzia sp. ANT_WB102]|uniref:hypothetical protein n=1 Tax=Dietzia sp. ANT_WB102 TaxID=2597345 RepID=UPI0011EBD39E|nr:hypothetical protein [Dietzia sp. ANT_WB102]KAA0919817.1 hypothetical protein FQ137_11655 [Dietzia sp. ANT_WB102]